MKDKIILYADEFPDEVWSDYCEICDVPETACQITIFFDSKEVEYKEYGEDDE